MKPCFLAVLLWVIAIRCMAQEPDQVEPFRVAPLVSFDLGHPLFINRSQNVLNPLPGTASGNSASESYGLGAELSWPHAFGSFGLTGLVQSVYNAGSFPFNGYSITGIDRKILAELSPSWDLEPFGIRVGPWISYSFSTSVWERDPTGADITPINAKAGPTHYGVSAALAWKLPAIPIQAELNSHFDLAQSANAGFDAASIGLSFACFFGSHADGNAVTIDSAILPEQLPTKLSPAFGIQFLANGSELHGPVPLERQERHVTEYTVDSNTNALHASQWMEESYKLPELTIRSNVAGVLRLSFGSHLFAELRTSETDTTIRLNDLAEWQEALAQMNIDSVNRIIAALDFAPEASAIHVLRDTLLLPPVDTNNTVPTIVTQRFRFRFSDGVASNPNDRSALDRMLEKISELSQGATTISIYENPSDTTEAHRKLVQEVGEQFYREKIPFVTMNDPGSDNELMLVMDR